MKSPVQLTKRLKEVLTEGEWVTGTNFKAQIFDLDWEKAIQKIESFNTIADLTFHVSYYIAGVINVLQGGALEIRDKYSFDYPHVTSHKDWRNLVNKFCSVSEKLIGFVENMTEQQLLEDFVDKKYGNYHRNVDVIIEHTYYHLGQIILIKKLLDIGKK